jgi:hypothetical protein
MPLHEYRENSFQYEEHKGNSSIENTERLYTPIVSKSFFNGGESGASAAILDFIYLRFQIDNFLTDNDNDGLVNSSTNSILVVNTGSSGTRIWDQNLNTPHNFFDLYNIESGPLDGDFGLSIGKLRGLPNELINKKSSEKNRALDSLQFQTDINFNREAVGFNAETSISDIRERANLFVDIGTRYGPVISRCLAMVKLQSSSSTSIPDARIYKIDCSLPDNTGSIKAGTVGRIVKLSKSDIKSRGSNVKTKSMKKGSGSFLDKISSFWSD